MRVVFKFAFAFFVASCICLGVFSAVLANRAATRLERMATDALLEDGAVLQRSFEVAWRDHGLEDARAILRVFDDRPGVDVAFLPDQRIEGVRVLTVPRSATLRISVSLPVHGPDERDGALRLESEVARGVTLVKDELAAELAAVLGLAITMAGIAAVLGAILIGRPLGRIVDQARRVGAGDLESRLAAGRNDEIGALEQELNVMCDRLAEAHERVEEEAAGRAATLEQLRHLDRLRTVGTIASSIAHELGTPLNVLLLRGQSLASGDIPSAEVAASGKAVVQQVEKMSGIVRQLLDFARGRRRSATELQEIDLSAVVEHACRLLDGIARKERVELVAEGTPNVRVHGDFTQLEQALTNLIVNAIQAMPRGGRVVVSVRRIDDGSAAVEVADEGDGIGDELRARIFEPFFTTKPTGEGTGLGLHVARGIIEDHGGALSVTSNAGRGSTFRLTLPRLA